MYNDYRYPLTSGEFTLDFLTARIPVISFIEYRFINHLSISGNMAFII